MNFDNFEKKEFNKFNLISKQPKHKLSKGSKLIAYIFILIIIIIILSIIIYKSYQINAYNKVNEELQIQLKEKATSILSNQTIISQTEMENKVIKTQIENNLQKQQQFQERLNVYFKENELIKNEIAKIQIELENKKIQFEELARQNSELLVKKESLLKFSEPLESEIIKYKKIINSLSQKLEEITGIKVDQSSIEEYPLFPESTIITQSSDVKEISQWVEPKKIFRFKLLFTLSKYGDSYHNFHYMLGKRSITNTLVIIKSKSGQIFGGYTNNNWDMTGMKQDPGAFLFNLNLHKKYPISFPDSAIYAGRPYLAFFGLSDLVVSSRRCFSTFPSAYGEGEKSFEVTGGEETFFIEEMEVFQLF